jgi:hypothetical protein
LTERFELVERLGTVLLRAGLVPALCLVLAGGLSGCHHKNVRSALPHGVLAPVELEEPETPANPPMIAEVPAPELAPLPTAPPPRPTPRRRPAAPKEEPQQPPAQVASAAAPADFAIGDLSTGGDAAPQSQQQARDLIASIVKRIAALPKKTLDGKKKQLSEVKRFLDQAEKSLNTGDADGAMNLATKAKLLMDDLEKK